MTNSRTGALKAMGPDLFSSLLYILLIPIHTYIKKNIYIYTYIYIIIIIISFFLLCSFIRSEVGGKALTGKSFRFVRACVRAVSIA